MSKKTLYLSDLDGTLLTPEAKLTDHSAGIINRLVEQGMLFTFATARSYVSAIKVTEKLRLQLPAAVYNGAFLVNFQTGIPMEKCILDKEKLTKLLQGVQVAGFVPLVYAIVDGEERVSWLDGREREKPGIRAYLESRQGDKRLRPVNDYAELFAGELFYLTFIGTKGEMEEIEPLCRNDHLYSHLQADTYNRDEYWLEAYRWDASKARALERLKDIAGADEVVCFGDNLNDLPMFQLADRCYAVEGAHPVLIAAATGVIGFNREEGVARWLAENA